MDAENLERFLRDQIRAKGLNWLVERVSKTVFLYGPPRSGDANDRPGLAVASYFQVEPVVEIMEDGKVYSEIILAMWNEYLTGHKSNNVGKGTLSGEYNMVAIAIIVGSSVLCLLAIAGGLYLGSVIF